ncbi:MAG TPA: biopolymer transporter ExbD [Gemmataceae bacterium]|nr:biopolymer transporter ExbD [Gemmataceae bacterium]
MTTRRKHEEGPEPTLPVTPMLDMAFQLLAFFVMTYHPSDLEGQMELSLPSESITQAKNQEQVKSDAAAEKNPLELPADVTVIVRTQHDNVNNGLISDLSLQDTAGVHPVGNSLDNLRDELKKRSETVENKENIKLQADAKLKWQEVLNVMDACHQAGFKNVSFVKPPG